MYIYHHLVSLMSFIQPRFAHNYLYGMPLAIKTYMQIKLSIYRMRVSKRTMTCIMFMYVCNFHHYSNAVGNKIDYLSCYNLSNLDNFLMVFLL